MESAVGRSERRLTLVILGSWAILCALQFGWLPFARHAWAVNLWAYQPLPVGLVLAVLALSISNGAVRRALISSIDRIGMGLDARAITAPVIGGVVFVLLWLFTDNELSPDARVFGGAMLGGYEFIFPDVGATWIIFSLERLGAVFGLTDFRLFRILSCLAGGVTIGLLVSMSRRGMLGPARPFGLATGLLLSAGLIRAFAGRVEVYPLLLVGVAWYVWLALRFLQNEQGWYLTCFAAGIAFWLHAAAIGLALSIVILPRLASNDLALARWMGLLVRGALVAAVPSLVFFLGLMFLGNAVSMEGAMARAVEILGGNDANTATRWWVRGWGGDPSIGTDIVFGSWAQLKYLANTAFLLCPSAVPVLTILFMVKGKQIGKDRTLRFLGALCLPLVAYSFALRPFWGPYDWDVFSMTALALILFQSYALELVVEASLLRHLTIWLVGFQLLFVGVPFLALRFVPLRDAGPFFVEGYMSPEIMKAATPPPRALEPWL